MYNTKYIIQRQVVDFQLRDKCNFCCSQLIKNNIQQANLQDNYIFLEYSRGFSKSLLQF